MRILHVVVAFAAIQTALSTDFLPIYVHTATWFVKGELPPNDLEQFLGLDQQQKPDLIVVTLQGLNHSTSKTAFKSVQNQWSSAIGTKLLRSGFVQITAVVSGTLGNFIYQIDKYKTFHIRDILNSTALSVDENPVPSALVTTIGWFGRRITIVNTKFTGKESEVETRFWEFYYIDMSRGLYFNDHVFWMGRLNFRVDKKAADAKKLIDANKLDDLLAHDQLKKGQRSYDVFIDWKEQKINFKPTYKFHQNSDEYNLDKTPSWPDRILYKTEGNRTLDELKYQSLNYKQFSQRPVMAQFSFNQPLKRK
ncbi:inositol polyphosphate 5-phosphatase OCRL-1 [Cimex lectularius]|uniref:Inositol polyphosphate-related phosphatase domain-containing protein n=3 Tax=Cimex lectularius TaxID=79782 RepID=A0A8I6RGI9_CIMLE|nr:inositol polyphosphate 5-phosphatase OCRL-1 [Cimex lectularius]